METEAALGFRSYLELIAVNDENASAVGGHMDGALLDRMWP
jgi:hypothetical protein